MLGDQGTVVAIEHLDRLIDQNDESKAKSKFYAIAAKVGAAK